VAGRMTKTGKAGMVGGVELPSIKSTFLAYEAGFLAGHPGGTAQPLFTAALGVFEGAEERAIWAFGTNKDQNALSPAVLASAVIDMPRAFVETARRVK